MSQLEFFSTPQPSFHNSTRLLPSQVVAKEVKNSKQNDQILKLFEDNPHCDFNPAEVWLRFGQQFPISNVRRCMSDLEKAGILVQSGNKRKGLYKDLNACLKFNPNQK